MSLPLMAAEPPEGYSVNYDDPHYEGYRLVIISIVFAVFSTSFLALRLYTRKTVAKALGMDDYYLIVACIFAVVFSVVCIAQCAYGTGRNMWNVTVSEFSIFLEYQIAVGITYIFALAFSKIAIGYLYLRLSPDKTFRTLVFICIGFVVCYSISGVFTIIFSCSPIAASWDLSIAMLPTTTCINRPASYLAQASFNIATDITLFILPVRTVWMLQLPLRQRLGVILMFASGLFVCVISIIRLKSIVVVLNSTDLTYDTNQLLMWSVVETHTAIICGCIPAMKPLISKIFPSIFGYATEKGRPFAYPSIPGKSTKLPSTSADGTAEHRSRRTSVGKGMHAIPAEFQFHFKSNEHYKPEESSPPPKQSFLLQNYPSIIDPCEIGKNKTLITAGHHRPGSGESQEALARKIGEDVEGSKTVIFVTKTTLVEGHAREEGEYY